MTKKLLVLLLSVILVVFAFTSCTLDLGSLQGSGSGNSEDDKGNEKENEGGNEEDNKVIENLIFDSSSELTIVVGEGVSSENYNALTNAIFNKRSFPVKLGVDTAEKAEHEIILGLTSRELTDTAMKRMNRDTEMKLSEDELYYCIYSDGSSIAIVFEEDYEGVAEKLAVEYFINKYITGDTLAAPAGVLDVKNFDIVTDYYEVIDNERRAELWAEAEKKVGAETVRALQSLTSLYTFELASWIANLYDPCICVCVGMGEETCQDTRYCRAQGGGFYFSNSARDTVGYLPDLESTRQALDMLNMSGMTWTYGGKYYTGALPTEMIQAIGRYTQVLQSPDGYFRHPQWADRADFDMRLNRDLSWATTLLNAAGMRPFYTTPTGSTGIGVPPELASGMTGKLNEAGVKAVSKVVATAATYPAILESVETFRKDLEEKSAALRTNSYGTGSRYSTYLAQINARDKVLGTPENPQPLMTMLYEWYEENKNPERGTWVGDESYGGNPKQVGAYAETNGIMKIIGCYSNIKRPYSYGLEAMQACIDVLTTDENPSGTVDIYNAFIALNGVYNAVVNYNTPEEAAAARELMSNFRHNATDAIVASRDKMALFKKPDGSFSYSQKGGSGTSMGMPTQVVGSPEGDVNGALIASADCWGHICSSLGITKVPFFGSAEMYKFRKIIEEADPVQKQGASMDYTTIDFEDDEVGEESASNISISNNSTGTSILVQRDEALDNNYLEFISTPVSSSAGGNQVKVICESRSVSATAFVFEGDICLKETSISGANFQINFGDINYFLRGMVSGDKLRLVEMSSDIAAHSIDMDLGVDIDVGDWFRLKVVYYVGDHDTVRIKVYFANLTDGETEAKLVAVSDNYWDQYGNKNSGNGKPKNTFTGTTIYALKSFDGTILLDNVASYRTKDTYTPESDPNNQPLYNVDPPAADEKIYDFEDGAVHSDITVNGNPTVSGGKLLINSATTLTVPINHRAVGGKCASIAFDVNCADAKVGDLFTVTASEPIGNVFSLVFTVMEDGEGKYITCREKAELDGKVLSGIRIPLGESVKIGIDYHHNEDAALIYVNDEFVSATDLIYKSANKRTIRTLSLTTASSGYEMTLDNLLFEKNMNSYEEATQPKKNSVLHNFEDGVGEALLDGSAKVEFRTLGDGTQSNVVEIGLSGGSVTVPVNHRANIFSVVNLSVDLYYSQSMNNGEVQTVQFIDNDGVVVFALALKINGKNLEICEVNKGGTAENCIASVPKSGVIKLGVDLFQKERIAHINVNNKCVAKTGIFADPKAAENTPMTLKISSSKVKSGIYLDNLKVESLYVLYEKVTPELTVDNEDTTNPLNFDKSSTGSVPKGIINDGTNFRIESMYNDVTGEYSNVGVLATIRGRNERIGVKINQANTGSTVTFETDFMISAPEYDQITQIFFTDGNSVPKGSLLGLIISKNGDGFVIKEYTSHGTGATVASGLSFDTFYNLKVEYSVDSATSTATVKVYINGELKATSAAHYRVGEAPSIAVKEAYFYTFLDSKCILAVDNMSLTISDTAIEN